MFLSTTRTTESREMSSALFDFGELYFISWANTESWKKVVEACWIELFCILNIYICVSSYWKSLRDHFFLPKGGLLSNADPSPSTPSKFEPSICLVFFVEAMLAASPFCWSARPLAHLYPSRCLAPLVLREPCARAACPWVDRALTLWWRTRAAQPGAWKQLTADSEGRASHPRISLQLAAASLSHNPLLGLLQSFQQTLSGKKMSCKIEIDWFGCRKGSSTC